MRSWVLLLLLAALLAARLRLGSAEGDPLPASLVDLVRNSPISSVDDLKLLLQQETNAIEEDEDDHDVLTNHTHGRYVRSLVEAQPAQQAACKVRTEVMEVTRSMLDRRNANFLLWPPCVEVQRCSGCCNTRLLQCVPTVTSSRYLQVIKIQYINRKAHYDKAVITVEDHVTCRCQTPSSSSSSSSSTQTYPNPPPPPPPPQQPPLLSSSHHLLPKTHASSSSSSSKADLHRHDDLKRNQQQHQQQQQGSYTQLVHWAGGAGHQSVTGMLGSWPSEARAEHSVMGASPGSGEDGGGEGSRQYHHHHHHHQYNNNDGADDRDLRTHHRLQSDSASSPPVNPTQPGTPTPSPAVTGRKQVTHLQKQTETEAAGQNAREEGGSANSGDSANQREGKDSKATGDDGRLAEEERRKKLLEMVQREPEKPTLLHPHHPQQRIKPTVVSTVSPMSAASRQAPFRPASPRRRRKHRKRISKAAMRAMIM